MLQGLWEEKKLHLMISDMKKQMNLWKWFTRKSDLNISWTNSYTVTRLMEGSWEDGAQIWDPKVGAYDPSKIHKINFNGKYHSLSAYHQTHPGPQRTPVLFQAGSSKAGKVFGAKHAEALFISGRNPAEVGPFVKEMRAKAAAMGRDPSELKFIPGIAPILGRTLKEAQDKWEHYSKYADYVGGLVKVSGFLGIDLSGYPLDEPFDLGNGAFASIQTMFETIKSFSGGQPVTPRMLGAKFAFCGFTDMPIGTPEMVADRIEEWGTVGDIDGFNVTCEYLHFFEIFLTQLSQPLLI
jgi:alkanesulfonate monooxygenase SsuD/methylene tetrahydromethanopterin reductase-like flavin-dependent oxidoreductase (luciferase family)